MLRFVSIGFIIFWKQSKWVCFFFSLRTSSKPSVNFLPICSSRWGSKKKEVWSYHIDFLKIIYSIRFSSQIADTGLKISLFTETCSGKCRRNKRDIFIFWLLPTCLYPFTLNVFPFLSFYLFVKYEINLTRWLKIFISSFYLIAWLSIKTCIFIYNS